MSPSMEEMESAQRLADRSFGVGGMPLRGKLKAPEENAPPDGDVRRAATRPESSCIVQAPAGSGKTALLVTRFAKLLTGVEKPEQLLAITFTRKAAAEMRRRVIEVLDEDQDAKAARDGKDPVREALGKQLEKLRQHNKASGWDLANNPSRLQIKTIDSFAMSLAGRLPLASGFGRRSQPLEDAAELYSKAAHKLLNRLFKDDPLSGEVGRFLELNDNNVDRARRLLVDMLRRRDQWLDQVRSVAGADRATAQAVLARGVKRLVDRVTGEVERSIPCDLQNELRWMVAFAAGNGIDPQLPSTLWPAAASLCMTQGGSFRKMLNKRQGFPADRKAEKERAIDAIEALKQRVSEEGFARLSRLPEPSLTEDQTDDLMAVCTVLILAVADLSEIMRTEGSTDFTELNLAARRALRSSDGGPTELALALDYKIRHMLIDEFQDTSTSQYELFELLVEGWGGPDDGTSLFAVGDPMQSIYRFRDADVTLFERAKSRGINQVALDSLELVTNFRSKPDVVGWVNRTFAKVMGKQSDPLTGQVPYSESKAHQGANGDQGVQARLFDFHTQEVAALVERIQAIKRQRPDDSIATLVRSRNHLPDILTALRTAGIKWRATDIDPLAEVPAVTDLLSLASALADPKDALAWLSVMRAPWVGLELPDLERAAKLEVFDPVRLQELADSALTPDGAQRLQRLQGTLARWLPQRHERPPRSSLEGIWLECGGAAAYGNAAAIDHAEQLFELVDQLGPDGWDATQLRRQAERLFAADNAPEKLEVLTIHKAKGLEWDHVLLPRLNGTTQGDTPPLLRWRIQKNDRTGDDLLMAVKGTGGLYDWLGDEEKSREINERRRLLYVACTRAKRSLMLTAAKWRSPSECGDEGRWKPPSASLLALLWEENWGEAAETPADQGPQPPPQEAEQPKHLHRLPEGFKWQPPQRPPLRLPHALAESTTSTPDTAGSQREVVFGELIHECLRRLSERPLPENANAWASAQRANWQRQLRAAGLPEANVEACVAEAIRQVSAVLGDETGRWLLGPRHNAASEYGITGVLEGALVSVRLDRTFEADGQRWIIDYKTGQIDANEASINAFAARHRPQLARYRALGESLFDRPIQTALYLTAIPRLINV